MAFEECQERQRVVMPFEKCTMDMGLSWQNDQPQASHQSARLPPSLAPLKETILGHPDPSSNRCTTTQNPTRPRPIARTSHLDVDRMGRHPRMPATRLGFRRMRLGRPLLPRRWSRPLSILILDRSQLEAPVLINVAPPHLIYPKTKATKATAVVR